MEYKKYTSDEFLSMNDLEGRYELIGGEIYAMSPSPSYIHQKIVTRLSRKIGDYIEDNEGECEVIVAPSDVKLDDENTVQPDIYVVCDKSKFDEHGCVGAPDWIIEILSPSNAIRDLTQKLELYLKSGVKEYWIVDPSEKKVIVYSLDKANITGFYSFNDSIPVGIYRSKNIPLSINISDII